MLLCTLSDFHFQTFENRYETLSFEKTKKGYDGNLLIKSLGHFIYTFQVLYSVILQ